MLLLLAWKNIWRNKKRSTILILAAALGLWGGVFTVALMLGLWNSMTESAINLSLSHLQIHSKDYKYEKNINSFINEYEQVISKLNHNKYVKAFSSRVVIDGLISSPYSNSAVKIFGINPIQEKEITSIFSSVKEGSYFDWSDGRVLIGKKLAELLEAKLGSKIVISFQNKEGEIVYSAFRVGGIYQTNSSQFDNFNLFIRDSDLFELLASSPIYHEIAVKAVQEKDYNLICNEINNDFPLLLAEGWLDISPIFKYANEMIDIELYIFLGIILAALMFGIVNTMLMSVLDRVREFGVLLAIGMKRFRLFGMIITETIMLSVVGSVVGLLLAYLTIYYFSIYGIDLSIISESLNYFGIDTRLYPILYGKNYLAISIMILITSVFSALYPAVKAVRLKPAESIRTY